MKIISNFKDIYDSTLMYGVDETRPFVRMTKRINLEWEIIPEAMFNNRWRLASRPSSKVNYEGDLEGLLAAIAKHYSKYDFLTALTRYRPDEAGNYQTITTGVMVFCGRIYPYLVQRNHFYSTEPNECKYRPLSVFFAKASAKETAEAMRRWFNRAGYTDEELDIAKNRHGLMRIGQKETLMDEMLGWLHDGDHNVPGVDQGLIGARVAYCLIEPRYNDANQSEVIIYPCLKDYEFIQVMSPHQMYQEIEMFNGRLVEDKAPPVEVADEYRQAAHGFGHKYAFRKRKKHN